MRIRKNARVLIEPGTSFLICKLNRSPWDDDSFFSQLVEEGWDSGLAHSSLVFDSNPSGDSMELSLEYIDNHVAPSTPIKAVAKREKCEGEIEKINETNMTSSCNEVDDYFAKMVISHSQQPPLVSAPSPQPKKRGRPKKPTQAAAVVSNRGGESEEKDNNNIDDGCSYYYYSGFGPGWKKKRGIIGNNNKNNSGSSIKRSKKNDYNARKHDDNNNVATTTSSLTQNMSGVDNDMEEYGVNNNKKSENGVVETVYDEQLDYIEDEFDDDDNEDDDGALYGGVARPRKHIKARSLKSLM